MKPEYFKIEHSFYTVISQIEVNLIDTGMSYYYIFKIKSVNGMIHDSNVKCKGIIPVSDDIKNKNTLLFQDTEQIIFDHIKRKIEFDIENILIGSPQNFWVNYFQNNFIFSLIKTDKIDYDNIEAKLI